MLRIAGGPARPSAETFDLAGHPQSGSQRVFSSAQRIGFYVGEMASGVGFDNE